MVARGEVKILFDAFYANSYGQYALVPQTISNAFIADEPPYDGVDAIFVSHVHGDHFTASPAIAYLRAHETVRLYGSKQVRDAVLDSGVSEDDPVMNQIIAVDLTPEEEAIGFIFGDLVIDVVAIPHAGDLPDIQNFVWRVTLDEKTTVMHLGDAGPVVSDFSRHMDHFRKRNTQTAFPPYWFLGHEDGEIILRDIINADHVIGIHVPARAAGNGDAWRARAGGDLFTDPGEIREISDNHAAR